LFCVRSLGEIVWGKQGGLANTLHRSLLLLVGMDNEHDVITNAMLDNYQE